MAKPIGQGFLLLSLTNFNCKTVLNSIPLVDWLNATSQLPIFDVRSEGEYTHAHFPNSFSLPLLNNEERAIIGTTYKREGNEAAVVKGYELVGPKFKDNIVLAKKLAPHKEVGVYCWRGGLRSNIMAFVLHTAGFKVHLLKGGYKSYRAWVLATLAIPQNIIVIGGKTGSGKTKIIQALAQQGEQTINLEQLANHRGSAFGALGMPTQPTVEHFENMLAMEWNKLQSTQPVFIENESRTIGSTVIPLPIFELMEQATTLTINISFEERVNHIVQEYGAFEKVKLKECTLRLAKRLGNLRLREALQLLDEHKLDEWTAMLLNYYDKTYEYGNSKRKAETVKVLSFDAFDVQKITQTIQTFIYQNGH